MKASVYIATSLDGYIAREDGDTDWLHSSGSGGGDEDYGYEDFTASVDVLIMGRNSFEKAMRFSDWPYSSKHVVVLSSRPVSIPAELSNSVEASSSESGNTYIQLRRARSRSMLTLMVARLSRDFYELA